MLAAAILAQQHHKARLVFAGGYRTARPVDTSEADVARMLLAGLGIPAARPAVVSSSRNTREPDPRTCSVRAKRGARYHVAVGGDGVPVACAVAAANVNDTLVFERLFLAAFAVMARIRTVFADIRVRRRAPLRPLPPVRRRAAHPQARPATRIRAGRAALAGRAQQWLGAGEQASRAAP
jgi:hypothetical protein